MNDQVAPWENPDGAAGGSPGPSPGLQARGAGSRLGPGRRYLNQLVSAVFAPAMCLSGRDGQIRAEDPQGLYVQDLRVLSELVVTINGEEPVHLGHDLLGGATNEFTATLLNPATDSADPKAFLTRRRSLSPDGMEERLVLNSYSRQPLSCHVELKLACDLAEVGAVNAGFPTEAIRSRGASEGLIWRRGNRYAVEATASPPPAATDAEAGTVSWDVLLEEGRPIVLSLAVKLDSGGAPALFRAPSSPLPLAEPSVLASDPRLAPFLELSLADLRGLLMAVPGEADQVFLAAGVPWYLTLFGRDSLWAARMLLPLGTTLAMGTLRALGARQGQRSDPRTGEEPGKILHEVRREGPALAGDDGASRAAHRGTWLPPVYYGTVDATALWTCLLHEAWKWGAPEAEVKELLPVLQGCLRWVRGALERGRGFVTYVDESGQGLSNQGWKDSFDGVQFRDGRLARAPLALCEVQGYAYQALTAGAELLGHFGLPEAEDLSELASGLAERFRARFWVEDSDGAFPAIALEADGTPVDSPSSNIGHLPGTGILNEEECELVARRLGSPELDCGYGLRTLSSACRGFNPLSYHLGSVWAHDTAIAISGLAQAAGPAAQATAASLIDGLLGAAEGFAYRLPELYGGHTRSPRARAPLPYPPACRPQAWAAASSVAVLAALAGLRPDVPRGRLCLSPLPSAVGLRRAEGLVVAGRAVNVELGPKGPSVEGLLAGISLGGQR
jgi:glycogen debranching enzyme